MLSHPPILNQEDGFLLGSQVMLDMQKSLQVRLAKDKPEYNRHPDDLATAGEAGYVDREQITELTDFSE